MASNEMVANSNQPKNPAKDFFQREDVKLKFKELLKDKSSGFITSVLSIVSASETLKKAIPESLYAAALKAAALDLPIAPELGFAYIIPYDNKKTGIVTAQFQIGYKGLLQLALRSKQLKTISATPVIEGQLKTNDPLKGPTFKWDNKKSEKVIGFASYIKLKDGFEKTIYMADSEVRKHAERFSKTYKTQGSAWDTDFLAMAQKTVLLKIIKKYAPLSIDLKEVDDIFEGVDVEPIYDGIDHVDTTFDGIDVPAN
jgi:recombination protein RecT